MNKTIKINISGILFQIEENAFEMLRDYLQAINNRFKNLPDGNETIDDIESRIAEIFQSQKGMAGMISKENVMAMIEIIGKPEEFSEHEYSEPEPKYTSQRRRMYRNRDDSLISGVAGGIGAYLNIDPVWIRILFILFTLFYGVGLLVYIALMIALPAAVTDDQKRELHGDFYYSASSRNKSSDNRRFTASSDPGAGNNGINRVGHVFNEIFWAIGKCFVIFFRIILILIGVVFVIAGFTSLLSFIMIFFFKYPGFLPLNNSISNIFYLPDFLNYFLTPSLTPWVIVLISVTVVLPLLAIIYWGIKMIFQFRAKDGILSLVFLLLWIASLVMLSMIFFSQGLSFAENGRALENVTIPNPSDTLYLKVDNKMSSLQFDREISIPGENYLLGMNKTTNELFIQPEIKIEKSEDGMAYIKIIKYSRGRTRGEALQKAENLVYNYRISNDTVYFDEYFKVPSGNKYSGAGISIYIMLPEGKIVYLEQEASGYLFHYVGNYTWDRDNKYRVMDEEGGLSSTQKFR
jgi:phage shock protein PspC (stress-responsive transcriptional regulator)